MNPVNTDPNKTSAKQKTDWLLSNQKKWEHLRGVKDNKQYYNVAREMKAAGLYAKSTFIGDIAAGVRKFVATH